MGCEIIDLHGKINHCKAAKKCNNAVEVTATSIGCGSDVLPHISEALHPSHITDRCEADHQGTRCYHWKRLSKVVEVPTIGQESILYCSGLEKQVEGSRVCLCGVGCGRYLLL